MSALSYEAENIYYAACNRMEDLTYATGEFKALIRGYIKLPSVVPLAVFNNVTKKVDVYKFNETDYRKVLHNICLDKQTILVKLPYESAVNTILKATSISMQSFIKSLVGDALRDDEIRDKSDAILGKLIIRNFKIAETPEEHLQAYTSHRSCMYFDKDGERTYKGTHNSDHWHENSFSPLGVHPCLFYYDSPIFKIAYVPDDTGKKAIARCALRQLEDDTWTWYSTYGVSAAAKQQLSAGLQQNGYIFCNKNNKKMKNAKYIVPARTLIHPQTKETHIIMPLAHEDSGTNIKKVTYSKVKNIFTIYPREYDVDEGITAYRYAGLVQVKDVKELNENEDIY